MKGTGEEDNSSQYEFLIHEEKYQPLDDVKENTIEGIVENFLGEEVNDVEPPLEPQCRDPETIINR